MILRIISMTNQNNGSRCRKTRGWNAMPDKSKRKGNHRSRNNFMSMNSTSFNSLLTILSRNILCDIYPTSFQQFRLSQHIVLVLENLFSNSCVPLSFWPSKRQNKQCKASHHSPLELSLLGLPVKEIQLQLRKVLIKQSMEIIYFPPNYPNMEILWHHLQLLEILTL